MLMALVNTVDYWDRLITLRIFDWHSRDSLDRFMYWISWSGNGQLYGLFAFFILIVLPTIALKFISACAIAFLFDLGLHKGLKVLVKRSRPASVLKGIKYRIKPPDKFSFPSGHAAGAFLMAYLIANFWQILAVPVYIWAACVAFSRIYNGVHYTSDVLVGILLGLACAHFALLFVG